MCFIFNTSEHAQCASSSPHSSRIKKAFFQLAYNAGACYELEKLMPRFWVPKICANWNVYFEFHHLVNDLRGDDVKIFECFRTASSKLSLVKHKSDFGDAISLAEQRLWNQWFLLFYIWSNLLFKRKLKGISFSKNLGRTHIYKFRTQVSVLSFEFRTETITKILDFKSSQLWLWKVLSFGYNAL
jgi:hypothetical protein